MPEVRKVSVSLAADQIAALDAAVEADEYATPGEIVREAIRDWQIKRGLREQEMCRLRELWDQGKASGDAAPLDLDAVKSEARRRLQTSLVSKVDDD